MHSDHSYQSSISRMTTKFVKKYANLSEDILHALQQFREETEQGIFPGSEHTFHIKDEVLEEILQSRREYIR